MDVSVDRMICAAVQRHLGKGAKPPLYPPLFRAAVGKERTRAIKPLRERTNRVQLFDFNEVAMAGKHPYISSGGPLVQAITQFRRAFPATIDASTLKKLGIAPNNESYLINILKFLELIEDDGTKTEKASKAFVLHKDDDFEKSFSTIVMHAYSELFNLHNDDAWTLDDESLITYFRQSDQSTEIVGKRQALTFKSLAGLSGKRELSAPRATTPKKTTNEATKRTASKKKEPPAPSRQEKLKSLPASNSDGGFGLTVRVEINLPADGSEATYDRIFKSIKENLIDAYKS